MSIAWLDTLCCTAITYLEVQVRNRWPSGGGSAVMQEPVKTVLLQFKMQYSSICQSQYRCKYLSSTARQSQKANILLFPRTFYNYLKVELVLFLSKFSGFQTNSSSPHDPWAKVKAWKHQLAKWQRTQYTSALWLERQCRTKWSVLTARTFSACTHKPTCCE